MPKRRLLGEVILVCWNVKSSIVLQIRSFCKSATVFEKTMKHFLITQEGLSKILKNIRQTVHICHTVLNLR